MTVKFHVVSSHKNTPALHRAMLFSLVCTSVRGDVASAWVAVYMLHGRQRVGGLSCVDTSAESLAPRTVLPVHCAVRAAARTADVPDHVDSYVSRAESRACGSACI